ncbi:Erg28 like protein-domain-containing protein [Dunaliella salina]|uniref:Erg28 like protein-domain-containing protein n=1 Tax=Dunaliella salina TaxID=3046 RepID=A0ABQ7GBD2_DUNSA|nr:Erg28 like protein-domain-containing protein [Dunaliella salina]|eukprot:KAF5831906.1 Erg28 like protein-domain-containing protein [Dunaliella salina]
MAQTEEPSTKALQRWLILVACFRLLSVGIGIFKPDKFKTTLFDLAPSFVNPLFGRLFAAWTMVTCILCVACAWQPTNRAIYSVTLCSFLVALAFFLSESIIFKTVGLRALASPLIVAGISVAWMSAGFNYYTREAMFCSGDPSKSQ